MTNLSLFWSTLLCFYAQNLEAVRFYFPLHKQPIELNQFITDSLTHKTTDFCKFSYRCPGWEVITRLCPGSRHVAVNQHRLEFKLDKQSNKNKRLAHLLHNGCTVSHHYDGTSYRPIADLQACLLTRYPRL